MTNNKIKLISSGILFEFDNVSDEKYKNYKAMRSQKFDTKTFKAPGFPYRLQIEPTNTCNLRCPLCPVTDNKMGRDPRHMKLEEFKKLIDDMERYLLHLTLWDWGEPFMNPEFPDMIKYATDRGISTLTSTNAHFLQNDEYVKRVLQSGLTCLIVAIDSLNEKDYEIYRQNGNLSKALAGLKNVVKLKKELKSSTLINLRMVVMKQNEHEIDKMKALGKEIGVDVFTLKTLNPSCGPNDMDEDLIPKKSYLRRYKYQKGTYKRIRKKSPICTRIWHMSNIYSDGSVVPCCYDYKGEIKAGNINQKPFTEIWNSQRYRDLRKKIYYDKDSIPKCKECTINFELAPRGEYPLVAYYNINVKDRIKHFLIDKVRKSSERYPIARKIIAKVKV